MKCLRGEDKKMKYRVHIEYEVPMFAEVDIDDVKGPNDAEVLALEQFEENNPEALEPTVVRVELI
jgi:hypothetical protein